MKAGCLKELFVCIKDKGPEEVVFDAIGDMGQMENSNGFRVSSCPRFGSTSVVTNSCRGYLQIGDERISVNGHALTWINTIGGNNLWKLSKQQLTGEETKSPGKIFFFSFFFFKLCTTIIHEKKYRVMQHGSRVGMIRSPLPPLPLKNSNHGHDDKAKVFVLSFSSPNTAL